MIKTGKIITWIIIFSYQNHICAAVNFYKQLSNIRNIFQLRKINEGVVIIPSSYFLQNKVIHLNAKISEYELR